MWVELGIVVGLSAMTFATWPMWRPRAHYRSLDVSATMAELETRRDLVYQELVDLDYDHSLGKISDQDIAPLLAESRHRAAGLLREIDRIRPLAESEVASAAAEGTLVGDGGPQAAFEACSSCGFSVVSSANFCPNCGLQHRDIQESVSSGPFKIDPTS